MSRMHSFTFLYKTIVIITIHVLYLPCVNGQNKKTNHSLHQKKNTIAKDTLSKIITSDELSIGNNLIFNKKEYAFKWGINPNPIYYKQEYFTRKEDVDNYTEKVTIEVITGNYKLNDALTLKIKELDSLISKNPIIDYEVFEDKKNNQFIIDFITDENKGFYEWNVHRYIKKKKPKEMIVLFKYSYRHAYYKHEDLLDFLIYAKKIRKKIIRKAYQLELPKIRIKK